MESQEPPRGASGRRPRSSSHSPSLGRGPHLKGKDKEGTGGRGRNRRPGDSDQRRRERWLLTRKTWRYMTDAVGGLLPEHEGHGTHGPPPQGHGHPGHSSDHHHHSHPTSTGGHPSSLHQPSSAELRRTSVVSLSYPGSTVPLAPEPPKRHSIPRSTICSASVLIGDPTTTQPTSTPEAEALFEKECGKQNKFLLWSRTKVKGLAGPPLREQKLKKEALKKGQGQHSDSGKDSEIPGLVPLSRTASTPGDFMIRDRSRGSKSRGLRGSSDLSEEDEHVGHEPGDGGRSGSGGEETVGSRRKSSAAASLASFVSGGLSFFKHHGSSSSSTVTPRPPPQKPLLPPTQLTSIGTQTEPFPDELLAILRRDVGIASHPLPPTSPTSPPEDDSGQGSDRGRSEESSSSSIGDTVLKYFRLARKGSKPDSKEPPDLFKTVNYDRSLRDIKSKNVTLEEALEYERRKGLDQGQGQGQVQTQDKSPKPSAPIQFKGQVKEPRRSRSKDKLSSKSSHPKDEGETGILILPVEGVVPDRLDPTTTMTLPLSSSVGLQAGEPLVPLLRHLMSPGRRLSELSIEFLPPEGSLISSRSGTTNNGSGTTIFSPNPGSSGSTLCPVTGSSLEWEGLDSFSGLHGTLDSGSSSASLASMGTDFGVLSPNSPLRRGGQGQFPGRGSGGLILPPSSVSTPNSPTRLLTSVGPPSGGGGGQSGGGGPSPGLNFQEGPGRVIPSRLDSSSLLMMQKSKSSSSVILHGGGGGRSLPSPPGGPEQRESSTSINLPPLPIGSSKGQDLRGRVGPPLESPLNCTWIPHGNCVWEDKGSGATLTLSPRSLLSLDPIELNLLRELAQIRLRELGMGENIRTPKAKETLPAEKPKRRPYLLKKKSMSSSVLLEAGSNKDPKDEWRQGKTKKVFGVPLSELVKQQKEEASGPMMTSLNHFVFNGRTNSPPGRSPEGSPQDYSGDLEVPSIVKSCLKHLEKFGLRTTGIFRVSTSIKRIRKLREEIDEGLITEFGEDHSVHDVAALLKEFLRDLPDSLIPGDLYHSFLRSQSLGNRKVQVQVIQHLIQLLPLPNRNTLFHVLGLLCQIVRNCEDTRSKSGEVIPGNKMDSHNLATLMAPNVLPFLPQLGAPGSTKPFDLLADDGRVRERQDGIDLVNFFIVNKDELFLLQPPLLDELYRGLRLNHPDLVQIRLSNHPR